MKIIMICLLVAIFEINSCRSELHSSIYNANFNKINAKTADSLATVDMRNGNFFYHLNNRSSSYLKKRQKKYILKKYGVRIENFIDTGINSKIIHSYIKNVEDSLIKLKQVDFFPKMKDDIFKYIIRNVH